MKNKNLIFFLIFIIFLIWQIIIPITLSKYTKTYNRTVTVNVRDPEYTIKFNANNGTGTMADLDMVYSVAGNLTTNTFTRTSYEFKGWNTKPDGSGTSYTDGQSVSKLTTRDQDIVNLYAQWERIYAITFNSDGGTAVASQTKKLNELVTEPTAPTKTDYNFKGWTLNGADYDFNTPVTDDITLVANWKRALSNPLITGNELAKKLRSLATGTTVTDGYVTDTNIKKIVMATDEQYEAKSASLTSNNIISQSGSSTPVYSWFEGDTIYIYSNSDKIKLTGNMEKAFAKMANLTDISALAYFDTTDVTNTNRMFQDCTNITSLEALADWDVSSITNMEFMFGANVSGKSTDVYMKISSLEPLKNWNVGNVTNMASMFKGCSSVTSLTDIKDWNVSKVTTFNQTFNRAGLTDATAIVGWDVRAVTTFNMMLANNSSLPSNKRPIFTLRPGTWNGSGTYTPSPTA